MSKEDRGHPNVFIPTENDLNAQDNFAFQRMAIRAKRGLGADVPAPSKESSGLLGLLVLGLLGAAAVAALSSVDSGDDDDEDERDDDETPATAPREVARANPAPQHVMQQPTQTFAMMMPVMVPVAMPVMVAAAAPVSVQPVTPEKARE